MPRVTVLMPAYNAERFIGEAVASVLAQTLDDFELIVVDDGSTDRTSEIVSMIDDGRVIVERNPRNLGLSAALNRGLSVARGELIAHHDADDISERSRLARQLSFLDDHRDIAVVGSCYRKIDPHGNTLGDRTLPLDPPRVGWALLFYCPIVHSAAMYRREIVLQAGGYDRRFVSAPDYALWSRLARQHRLANVPERLVRYRVGHASLSASMGDADGGREIALENVAALLAPASLRGPTAVEHRAMYDALFRGQFACEPAVMVGALERLGPVLDAFCRQPMISGAEAAALRTETWATLQRVLMEWIDVFTDTEFARARACLPGGDRWLELLSTRRARSAFAAVRRSPVGRALARLAARDQLDLR